LAQVSKFGKRTPRMVVRFMSFQGHTKDVFIPSTTQAGLAGARLYHAVAHCGVGLQSFGGAWLCWQPLPQQGKGLLYATPSRAYLEPLTPLHWARPTYMQTLHTSRWCVSVLGGSLAIAGLSAVASNRTGWRFDRRVDSSGVRQQPSSTPVAVNFGAGILAGVASDVPLHPIDTIKTRLQAKDGFKKSGGFRGLWAGMSTVLLRSAPCSAIFFVSYEPIRHGIEKYFPSAHGAMWCDAAAGAGANLLACVVRTPCEVLKQRMQAPAAGLHGNQSKMQDRSMTQFVRALASEGAEGCFAGLNALLMRELAFAVIQMPIFEMLKHHALKHDDFQQGDELRSRGVVGTLSGGVAGSVAGALTTPLDTAKTRMMLASQKSEQHALSAVMKSIYSEAGFSGLFRGVIPRTLYVGASSALWLGAFEWSKAWLGGFHGLQL